MKKISLILLLIIIIALFSLPVSAKEQMNEDHSVVTIENATRVAHRFIENSHYSYWDQTSFEFQKNLYDIDDQVLAYYFHIFNHGELVGYIVVSANKNIEPILQYGEHKDSSTTVFPFEDGKKTYYLGAFKHLIAEDKTQLMDEFHQQKDALLRRLSKELGEHSVEIKSIKDIKLKSIERSSDNINKWEHYLEKSKNEVTIAALPNYKVLSVTRHWQRMSGVTGPGSACGPTSGAMIIDYLINQKNFFNIDGSNDYTNGTAGLINHLRSEMSTTFLGTSMSDWRLGMYNYLNSFDHNNAWRVASVRADESGVDTTFKTRISHDEFPVTFRFDYWTSSGVAYDYHFVVGVGYDHTGSSLKFGIKDPDGGQYNTGIHWYDYAVNDQDMAIGHMWRYFN